MMQERSAGFEKNDAIDMAVYSGNLLVRDGDNAHAWVLTLIISNLFEMVGEGETAAERFADGFDMIARLGDRKTTVLGWDLVSIAKAIRNWIDHGLALDRLQEMNSVSKARARVENIGLIPISNTDENDPVYRVYLNGVGKFELHFAPARFWLFVQEWYKTRERS